MTKVVRTFRKFIETESSGGIMLMIAALVALIIANSSLHTAYEDLLHLELGINLGAIHIEYPLHHWINDGLMAIFFLMVGLELKREIKVGHLSDPKSIALPALGALGGMLFPVLIYILFNHGDEIALRGWAIPAATDIAFALGILSLLGKRVPLAFKVFLVSLAIFDDVGSILIIAVAYTEQIAMLPMLFVAACIGFLILLNRLGATRFPTYLITGVVLWFALLESGLHATLAGVILALFIPMNDTKHKGRSPLIELEHELTNLVAFVILPVFAFANAGINLKGLTPEFAFHSVSVGVATGLFFGKQIGVMLFCWLGVRMGVAKLSKGMDWKSLYGISILAGVGFTMSLFVGGLAFAGIDKSALFDERIGILAASVFSGGGGFLMLAYALRDHRPSASADAVEAGPDSNPTRKPSRVTV